MRLPPEATKLLHDQLGVIARRQLILYMSEHAIEGLVQRGQLIPIQRGVYRAASCPSLPEHGPIAAALRAGPDAAVTGPVALAMRGVHGVERTDPWEILMPPGRRLVNVDFRVRRNPLPQQTVNRVQGMPILSATAALIDSARFVDLIGSRALRLAYDSSRWRGLTTAAIVRQRLTDLGPSDLGAREFMFWDERGELDPESEGERQLGDVLGRIDPLPTPQVKIGRFRIDLYWDIFKFGYEYHGSVDHTSAADRLADSKRSHAVRLNYGVELRSVTQSQLADPERLLQRTLALLTARAVELDTPLPRIV